MGLERRLGLKDDESLLAVVRSAPVTLLLPGVFLGALILCPFFFLVPLLRLELLGKILIGLSESIGLFFCARGLVKWRMTVLAVTERRVVIVRQNGFFDRHVTELPFSRIQEVAYRVSGMGATIFGYGTLLIESAGSDEPLAMERVPHPARLQDLITELQGDDGAHGEFGDILHAVSRMDARKLGLLKAELERASRALPPDERA
ncbi:MAG TPA: PH domain-containing protein [Candidatus Baltobacteraceae bacterium]|nr:PH domain-containing protein [Candidatus Baltobacteraceae bacterium]